MFLTNVRKVEHLTLYSEVFFLALRKNKREGKGQSKRKANV